jgi:hypothetical protein
LVETVEGGLRQRSVPGAADIVMGPEDETDFGGRLRAVRVDILA